MGDYISRQAAIEGFYEMSSNTDYLCTVGDYVHFLESLSSADAVKVVRCKDCIHFTYVDGYWYGTCHRINATFNTDDYCSYWEEWEEPFE